MIKLYDPTIQKVSKQPLFLIKVYWTLTKWIRQLRQEHEGIKPKATPITLKLWQNLVDHYTVVHFHGEKTDAFFSGRLSLCNCLTCFSRAWMGSCSEVNAVALRLIPLTQPEWIMTNSAHFLINSGVTFLTILTSLFIFNNSSN